MENTKLLLNAVKKEHPTEMTPTSPLWQPSALGFAIIRPEPENFWQSYCLFWEKAPCSSVSKVTASQYELRKMKLVEYKKEQSGNKLVYHHYKWKAA